MVAQRIGGGGLEDEQGSQVVRAVVKTVVVVVVVVVKSGVLVRPGKSHRVAGSGSRGSHGGQSEIKA